MLRTILQKAKFLLVIAVCCFVIGAGVNEAGAVAISNANIRIDWSTLSIISQNGGVNVTDQTDIIPYNLSGGVYYEGYPEGRQEGSFNQTHATGNPISGGQVEKGRGDNTTYSKATSKFNGSEKVTSLEFQAHAGPADGDALHEAGGYSHAAVTIDPPTDTVGYTISLDYLVHYSLSAGAGEVAMIGADAIQVNQYDFGIDFIVVSGQGGAYFNRTNSSLVWEKLYFPLDIVSGGSATDSKSGTLVLEVNAFDNYTLYADIMLGLVGTESKVSERNVWGTAEGTPIPEPATMLLLGAGLMGLAALGRKRMIKN